jgi:hypothetical protein
MRLPLHYVNEREHEIQAPLRLGRRPLVGTRKPELRLMVGGSEHNLVEIIKTAKSKTKQTIYRSAFKNSKTFLSRLSWGSYSLLYWRWRWVRVVSFNSGFRVPARGRPHRARACGRAARPPHSGKRCSAGLASCIARSSCRCTTSCSWSRRTKVAAKLHLEDL